MNLIVLFLAVSTSGVPINLVQKAAENDFETLDNYLPKIGDYPKFHYSTFGEDKGSNENVLDVIDFKSIGKNSADLFGNVDFYQKDASVKTKATEVVKNVTSATVPQETTTIVQEITTLFEETTTDSSDEKFQLDPVFLDETGNTTMNRTTRQKESNEENDVEVNGAMNDREKENQESDEEEEEPDMITGLISAFLGGLSRPDGSVDVEAITGLLGSLSTQNEDGSYDFNGLTELLMSFFGGGGEEGGGSDFGAFLGGLLGAFIKGVANPPGAKGSGIFVGNLLTGVLPALSGPAPTEESSDQKPQPPLDSGGFLGGLLQPLIGSIGSLSGGGSDSNGGGGSKFSLFKAIFSTITSVFSSSSATH